jgi:hypothetical protein
MVFTNVHQALVVMLVNIEGASFNYRTLAMIG